MVPSVINPNMDSPEIQDFLLFGFIQVSLILIKGVTSVTLAKTS
jgi:hypothetical protein